MLAAHVVFVWLREEKKRRERKPNVRMKSCLFNNEREDGKKKKNEEIRVVLELLL